MSQRPSTFQRLTDPLALTRRKAVRPRGAAGAAPAILTVRPAFPDDAQAVARLAALDSQRVPAGPLLVAEVAGELWAAVALDGAAELGDPFRPTAELVVLLRERARQLTRTARPRPLPAGRALRRLRRAG
jgi:hypothetical protein